MRSKRGPIGLLVLSAAFLVFALGASSAQAEFGIARWEALTCNTDESEAGLGSWAANGEPCIDTDPGGRFYTQAAGHPPFGVNAFLMNQVAPGNFPDGFLKETRTELPEGLGVNPQATPQCTVEELSEVKEAIPSFPVPIVVPNCPAESRVGTNYFTIYNPEVPAELTAEVYVYNVETPADPESPYYGASSMAGFNATGKGPTLLVADTDPKDQHISFTVHDLESPIPPEKGVPIVGSRLVFNGQAGKGYITIPSECNGPQTTILKVLSHPYPPPEGPELERTDSYSTNYEATGCDKVPFNPGLGVAGGDWTDSPNSAMVNVTIPFNPDPEGITDSQLHVATVVLPEGAGINPSAGNSIEGCTDAQFGQYTNNPITCPDKSKIGSVEVETPSLPGVLGGEVYVGQPLQHRPEQRRTVPDIPPRLLRALRRQRAPEGEDLP